jgi:SAM-dependent methyltransferase
VEEGVLKCQSGDHSYPITAGIPRFVPADNYAASFGYQWNLFRSQQIDSVNGTSLSSKRLFSETRWSPEWLRGKWILDAGCGAARFLDVVSQYECEAVGVDISIAVDAARQTLAGRDNVHLVQASIYELPFRAGVFDGCYCIGVIQHTPEPRRTLAALPRILKAGGRIAVTIYERRPWTFLYPKYLVRPITKRLDKTKLLSLIKGSMPLLFPVTNLLFRLPALGPLFIFAIPVANYVDEPQLSAKQRYDWAILDTFDMLSPQFDQPQTEPEVTAALQEAGIVDIQRLPMHGVNLIGRKAS